MQGMPVRLHGYSVSGLQSSSFRFCFFLSLILPLPSKCSILPLSALVQVQWKECQYDIAGAFDATHPAEVDSVTGALAFSQLEIMDHPRQVVVIARGRGGAEKVRPALKFKIGKASASCRVPDLWWPWIVLRSRAKALGSLLEVSSLSLQASLRM